MDSISKKDFNYYRKKVDKSIQLFISKENDIRIREILEHSLEGGKRIRPIICLLVFKKFIKNIPKDDSLINIALLPEIIHNISLIIDDLPCMDNDNYRRNKGTTHFKYGILPSYITIVKLINNIFFEFKNFIDFNKRFNFRNRHGKLEVCVFKDFFTNLITKQLTTLIEGQYYDLQFLNVNVDIEILYRINSKKTAPLFSLSFILGYLMITHYNKDFILESSILEDLKNLGELFGFIFQLNDDILDRDQDSKEGKCLNISLHLGYDESLKVFDEKCRKFETYLKKVGLLNENFKEIIMLLKKRLVNNN
jgi:geranylgeranyl diphosphate synthase, type II